MRPNSDNWREYVLAFLDVNLDDEETIQFFDTPMVIPKNAALIHIDSMTTALRVARHLLRKKYQKELNQINSELGIFKYVSKIVKENAE